MLSHLRRLPGSSHGQRRLDDQPNTMKGQAKFQIGNLLTGPGLECSKDMCLASLDGDEYHLVFGRFKRSGMF